MKYEGYKKGYSTLPNLKKLSPEEVFEKDNSDSEKIMMEKCVPKFLIWVMTIF